MLDSQTPEAISDEVLSAFLDGELPAGQMAQVERWLATSPAAHRRLQEFRRVSGWLRELPRCELPSEFASQVLQEAERRMLLPAARPLAAPGTAGPVRFRRLLWVAAPLTTAALALVVVSLWGPGGDPQVAVKEAPPRGTPAIRSNRSTDLIVSAKSAQPPGGPADSAAEIAAGPPAVNALSIGSPSALGSDQPGEAPSPLEAVPETAGHDRQVADLIRKVEEANHSGRLAGVRIVVVDRMFDLSLLQILFDESQIEREPGDAAEKPNALAANAAGPKAATDGASGRQGLYVVADVADLTRALEALRQQQKSAQWSVETIDVARLDQASHDRAANVARKIGVPDLLVAGAPSPGAKGGGENRSDNDVPIVANSDPSAGIANVGVTRRPGKGQHGGHVRVTFLDRQHEGAAPAAAKATAPEPGAATVKIASAADDAVPRDTPKLVQLFILLDAGPAQEAADDNSG